MVLTKAEMLVPKGIITCCDKWVQKMERISCVGNNKIS